MPDIPIDCILIRFSDISHLFCRSRDSTLRAIALTSSRNLSRWQPLLLQAVSLSKISVKSFMSLDPEKGDMVKSFRFHHHPNFDEDGEVRRKAMKEIITLSPAPDDLRDKTQARELAFNCFSVGATEITRTIFIVCWEVEELIVEDPLFLFHFTFRYYERSLPFPFLRRLKKLFICRVASEQVPLSARNFIWLAVFVSTLHEISVSFDVSQVDIKFLKEYKETFKHQSNVKKVAISFKFIAPQSGTRSLQWKLNGKRQRSGISGKAQSQCISDLLSVTKGLKCLEINGMELVGTEFNEWDDQQEVEEINLSSISNSLGSLIRFRQLLSPLHSLGSQLSLFSNLKYLSTEGTGLIHLQKEEITLKIEVIQLTWYLVHESSSTYPEQNRYPEDFVLADLIDRDMLPKLKTVVVPRHPIGVDGVEDSSAGSRTVWAENRRVLKVSEYFKSGKITLMEIESGSYCEFFGIDDL